MGHRERKVPRRWRRMVSWMAVVMLSFMNVACYYQGQHTPDAWDLTDKQIDSISFSTTHHYSQNYNFMVKSDSLVLQAAPSDDASCNDDSVVVYGNDRLVVADIRMIPSDTIDSVWVKLARDQNSQGWVREKTLLTKVAPDDPISRFIDTFSNVHLLVFMALLVIVVAAYGIVCLRRRHAKIVHFNDIGSCYPTVLALLVATSATMYSSIQLFGDESWRHFYYHPSLNPFTLPPHIALFVTSVWGLVIVLIATIDDVLKQQSLGDALLYMLGLAAVCAVDYVVFSVSTLYYIGYPLLVAYFFFAIRRYLRHASRCMYICGNCGAKMTRKGVCPNCGALNE